MIFYDRATAPARANPNLRLLVNFGLPPRNILDLGGTLELPRPPRPLPPAKQVECVVDAMRGHPPSTIPEIAGRLKKSTESARKWIRRAVNAKRVRCIRPGRKGVCGRYELR